MEIWVLGLPKKDSCEDQCSSEDARRKVANPKQFIKESTLSKRKETGQPQRWQPHGGEGCLFFLCLQRL